MARKTQLRFVVPDAEAAGETSPTFMLTPRLRSRQALGLVAAIAANGDDFQTIAERGRPRELQSENSRRDESFAVSDIKRRTSLRVEFEGNPQTAVW